MNKGDFGVRIAAGRGKGTILYPDVVVDLQSGGASERATQTPVVVVEVLSESTDFDDHVEKFGRYARRPELRVYLVFAQQETQAWVWRRAVDGTWPASPAEVAANGAIDLPEIGARLALADIYR